jgi:hypothetical protein
MLVLVLVLVPGCKKHDAAGPGTEPDLSGKLEFRITDTQTGALLCDAEIALSGTEYTGAGVCRDCDFQFEMETTVVSEDGPACAEMYADYPELVLMPHPSPYADTVFLGFADTYHLYGGDYTMSDVILVGDGGGGSVPYMYPGFWDSYVATVSYADGELEWAHDTDAASGVTAQVDGRVTIAL